MTDSEVVVQNILVSVVAPFYNEQESIAEFFRRLYTLSGLQNSRYIFEVIAVNGGSDGRSIA